jgi:CDP-paratose 2-epimerase
VAWFVIAALMDNPITIYGNGKQVRDVLYVDDLLDAYDAAVTQIDTAAGKVFNIGGGPENTMSIWVEFAPMLEKLLGRKVPVTWDRNWRPGDQPVYISDIRTAKAALGWEPKIGVEEGVRRLFEWVSSHRHLFS